MTQKLFFGHPQAQFETYREEILRSINKVLQDGPYILGTEVENLEKEFAAFCGVEFCSGVGSGTDALTIALRALGVGAGDEVITVSHTAVATAAAIVNAGATPVLIDVTEDTYVIDCSQIEAAISPKTKAIIPVHLYGHPCDMDKILEIAKKHGLFVVEDCAQAHGAEFNGKRVGSMGDVGCFSFYPTKNLGAIGDGGAIVSRDAKVDQRIKRLRQYGWDSQRLSQEPGFVSRLDELQASILRVKLKGLANDNQKRIQIARNYTEFFANKNVKTPATKSTGKHVFHLYVIQVPDRELIMKKLKDTGIEAGIHYQYPVHIHPGYKSTIRIASDLKVTNRIINSILTLPIYPELDFSMVETRLRKVFE